MKGGRVGFSLCFRPGEIEKRVVNLLSEREERSEREGLGRTIARALAA